MGQVTRLVLFHTQLIHALRNIMPDLPDDAVVTGVEQSQRDALHARLYMYIWSSDSDQVLRATFPENVTVEYEGWGEPPRSNNSQENIA